MDTRTRTGTGANEAEEGKEECAESKDMIRRKVQW